MDKPQTPQTQQTPRRRGRNANTNSSPAGQQPSKQPPTPASSQPSRNKGRGNSNHNRANHGQTPRKNEKRTKTPEAAASPHDAPPTTTPARTNINPMRNVTPHNKSASPSQNQGAPDVPYFAGHTFGQSPAASALPIPGFCSKQQSGASPPTPQSPTPATLVGFSSSNSSSDSEDETPVCPEQQTSPLDMLFNAKRRECGRSLSETSSASLTSDSTTPSVASSEFGLPAALSRQVSSSSSSSGISAHELDGSPRVPMGPTFSGPQRIWNTGRDYTSVHANTPRPGAHIDHAADIKKILWGNSSQPSNLPSSPPQPQQGFSSPGFNPQPFGLAFGPVSPQSPPRPMAGSQGRNHWESIYGQSSLSPDYSSDSARTPDVASIENQLLTLLNVRPVRQQATN